MKRKVKFAVLQYIPNIDRDEKVNVAIVLHSPSDEYMKTILITNYSRIKKFDDELDINFFKQYLKSIKDEFTYDLYNKEIMNISDYNLINNMTKFYVNQFIFKIVESVIDESCDEYIEKIKKNFLYFDCEKKNRVSSKESIEFFCNILKSKNINYEILGNKNSLYGNFNEKINVDMKSDNKYYKIINFNDSNVDKYMSVIKMWMLNAIELKEKNEELIFIVNGSYDNEKVNIFIKMLDKYGKVFKLEDASLII